MFNNFFCVCFSQVQAVQVENILSFFQNNCFINQSFFPGSAEVDSPAAAQLPRLLPHEQSGGHPALYLAPSRLPA
jgi:hypothetical protein